MRPHAKEPEEEIIVERELRRMRKTLNFYIAASLTILVLIVGGWARAEVRIGSNAKDNEYTRENALNKKAFISHVDSQEAYEQAVAKIVENHEAREALIYFNKRMNEINDKIAISQTEIVPRGAGNTKAETKKREP